MSKIVKKVRNRLKMNDYKVYALSICKLFISDQY